MDEKCKEQIADAATIVVLPDLRPLSFAEKQEGMTNYARAIFQAGQSTPLGVKGNDKSFLLSRTAIHSSIVSILGCLRSKVAKLLPDLLNFVEGAVSIDGVTL